MSPTSIEELAPGAVPVWPQVVFSTGESWAAVAGHYSDLVGGQLADMDLEGVVAKALREGGNRQSREEKVSRLVKRARQKLNKMASE